MSRLWWPIVVVWTMIGCAEPITPVMGCKPHGGLTPDCRFTNPEDMAPLPSGDGLLVSQMGSMDGAQPGNLVAFRPRDGTIEVVVPVVRELGGRWGDAACTAPDWAAFSPHGIDLEQRADGRWMLLVVNHGLRESVEFFELVPGPTDLDLRWRGCVLGPEDAFFNDVVARRDGGFWATHMMSRSNQTIDTLRAILGSDVGWVYEWDPAEGFRELAGSGGPFPNGLEKSADERYLFVNMYFGDQVRKLDIAAGRIVASVSVSSPDNSSWSNAGELLVASHTDSLLEMMACQNLSAGSCGHAFEVVVLDPGDLSRRTVFTHGGGPPMGGVTVAVHLGDALYFGTHAGDRIGRVDYSLEGPKRQ